MPRVAIVAAALFVVRLLLTNTPVGASSIGIVIRAVTVLAVGFTVAYYGLKILVRLKQVLLWRVRRRLIITYLFVGLTPIILMTLLGLLAAIGSASQTMVRVVRVEVNTTERQARDAARSIVGSLSEMPQVNGPSQACWTNEPRYSVRCCRVRASTCGPARAQTDSSRLVTIQTPTERAVLKMK